MDIYCLTLSFSCPAHLLTSGSQLAKGFFVALFFDLTVLIDSLSEV